MMKYMETSYCRYAALKTSQPVTLKRLSPKSAYLVYIHDILGADMFK